MKPTLTDDRSILNLKYIETKRSKLKDSAELSRQKLFYDYEVKLGFGRWRWQIRILHSQFNWNRKKKKIKRSAGIEERNILMYKHISISIYTYKRRKIERLEGRKNAILSRRLNCDQG